MHPMKEPPMSQTDTTTATTRTVDGVEVPPAGTYAIDASHSRMPRASAGVSAFICSSRPSISA